MPNTGHGKVSERLLRQVAQIGDTDIGMVTRASAELTGVDAGFRSQYVGFNDGHWHSAVLVNPSGRNDDHLISDGIGRPTKLAELLPTAMRIVDDVADRVGMSVCWARLALMDAGARVWEHRDFLELKEQDKVRLHVPMITNSKAMLHFEDAAVHMAKGHVWHLATDVPHGASNDGPARVHLIIDCDGTPGFLDRVTVRTLDPSLVSPFPVLDEYAIEGIETEFRDRLVSGDLAGAERLVLSLFGSWNLDGRTTYGILARFFENLGDWQKAAHWRTEERDKLYERVS
ncbi:aspartyl/asparaginyl beta-hydroxylase domain-containing protein [Bradyrhizobium sp. AUGA SZCCT0274]|uniref:aspartyl/asparaginyl beta-hydroxylase domain-containing protein n=1 Tax=Bradyrhizobium sp. AUGA SZCCT0274 TaxID=2807670 RepID=UPI001BAADB51|nr:aspartyl/asparaginyl beta-hydroxylase domain-containing protein [Bradyrhizobium sp. AUGA SZCCT0274]MBR1240324.1 aspartyl/asparaginyl beta-hydroxylase domain-containing protein [Bradyrhizobium sp. AUGA SZCCT0274]